MPAGGSSAPLLPTASPEYSLHLNEGVWVSASFCMIDPLSIFVCIVCYGFYTFVCSCRVCFMIFSPHSPHHCSLARSLGIHLYFAPTPFCTHRTQKMNLPIPLIYFDGTIGTEKSVSRFLLVEVTPANLPPEGGGSRKHQRDQQ